MSFFWLCYRSSGGTEVVIQKAPSVIHARLVTNMAGLDQGLFAEWHELPAAFAVPEKALGRRLRAEEAAALLASWEKPAPAPKNSPRAKRR